jgi:hypothetical protein
MKGENTQITKSATNKIDLLFPPARNVNAIEPTDPINIITKAVVRQITEFFIYNLQKLQEIPKNDNIKENYE